MLLELGDALWDLIFRKGRPPTYWHGEDPAARPYAPKIIRHHTPWPGDRGPTAGRRPEPWPYQPWPGERR